MEKRWVRKKVKLSEVKFDPNNPNKMTAKQEEALSKSLEKFGYVYEVVVDANSMIVADGEHRIKRLIKAGVVEAEVILFDFKNDAERRLFRQVANKVRGEHDFALDSEEYRFFLKEGNFDELKAFLGEDKKLVQFLASVEKEGLGEDSLDVEGALAKPKYAVNRGDVWELGKHKLVCGDATLKEDVDLLMGGEKADLVFTDPPYGIDYHSESGSLSKDMQNDEYDLDKLNEFFKNSFSNIDKVLVDSGCLYVWHSDARGDIKPIFENNFNAFFEMSATLIWVKNNSSMGYQDYRRRHEPCLYGWKGGKHKFYGDKANSTVWEVDRDTVQNYVHPTQKPVELALKAISNSSLPNQVVLDLFGGSGSTLIACEKLNRRCFMMEISEKYCSVILERWETVAGKKAKLVRQSSAENGGE